MNRQETIQIMAVLKAAYPNYYKDMSRKDADSIVNLWQEMFSDDDYRFVDEAIKTLISTDSKGFPPNIGTVKEQLRRLTDPPQMTELEAWDLVSKAVRATDWNNPSKQFDKLPPEIRATLGSANTLVEWGNVDEDAFGTVVASNFQRSYRAKSKSLQEYKAIPASVKAMLGALSEKLSLTEGKSD